MLASIPRVAMTIALALVFVACTAGTGPSSTPTSTMPMAMSIPTPAPSVAATVTTASVSPTVTARPTPRTTPAPEPQKPTEVKFAEQARVSDDQEFVEITQSVTWRAPRSEGVEIRVYGVTECIAEPANPAPDTSGPCLVEHTPLPASVRTLLASAPAADGAVSWTWTSHTGCDIGLAYDPGGPAYHSVVLAAYNASGHSIFAIAEPGGWWRPGLNDIVC